VNRLLAKSYDQRKYGKTPPDYALLTQHSRDVAMACDALACAVGALALSNAGLSPTLFKQFRRTLRANGWIQDLGKAGSHFQEMVTKEPQIKQLLRHETISGLLILLNERLRQWLSPLSETLLMAVWGAMGHHRKFDERTTPLQFSALTVHVAHPDFAQILSEMSVDLGLEAPPRFDRNLTIARTAKEYGDFAAREHLRDLQDTFKECEADFVSDEQRRLLALIKGFGIAADVAASAVAARGQWATHYSLATYIAESFAIGLTPEELSVLISTWAWERSPYARDRRYPTALPSGFIIRDFQSEVACSEAWLTLAQAGCGSGKSLAAYMWARMWCQRFTDTGRTNFRLFFCLPTTGTTTEHFKDYALESGIDASLCHSRASVDLRAMAETAVQEEASEGEQDAAAAARTALQAERDKIESLALWSTPLVVTTADTVLGLMSNARRAVYSLPAIMCSAIVFDEIHAFDEQLFGHLLVFLKNWLFAMFEVSTSH
jgi:CRISPR-associated endonuclease/helicase Cas3